MLRQCRQQLPTRNCSALSRQHLQQGVGGVGRIGWRVVQFVFAHAQFVALAGDMGEACNAAKERRPFLGGWAAHSPCETKAALDASIRQRLAKVLGAGSPATWPHTGAYSRVQIWAIAPLVPNKPTRASRLAPRALWKERDVMVCSACGNSVV